MENKYNPIDFNNLDNVIRENYLFNNNDTINIIKQAEIIFENEPNIINIDSPVIVIGDIHGDFCSIIQIFKLTNSLENIKFLFLGDIVDKGIFSIECMLLLLIEKINHPNKIFIIRGNHESSLTTSSNGFKWECMQKYNSGIEIYGKFIKLFRCIPIGAIIDNKIWCVHGGLSQLGLNISSYNEINRFVESVNDRLLLDTVWSDPDKYNVSDKICYSISPRNIIGDTRVKIFNEQEIFLVNRKLLSMFYSKEYSQCSPW